MIQKLVQNQSINYNQRTVSPKRLISETVCLFVWGFAPYQQYFTATVHKSVFPGPFLISA